MKLLFDATSLNRSRKDGLNRYVESLIHYLNEDDSLSEFTKDFIYLLSDTMDVKSEKRQFHELLHGTDFRALLTRYFTQIFYIPFFSKAKILYFPLPEGTLVKRKSQKQIVTIHDLLPLTYPEVFPKVKYHYKYYLPQVLKNSDLVITVSDFTASQVREKYNYKGAIKTIYQGYREDIFFKKDESTINEVRSKFGISGKYVITVGETRKYKNTIGLIEAFSYVSKDISLIVVGKINRLDNETFNRAKELGLEDQVKFLGFVSDEDLSSLYNGSDAFAFMSLYEGFGIPVLEAMACGAQLILSDIQPFREIADGIGAFVDATNPEEIANTIQDVVFRENRSTHIEAGYERVKKFTWKNFIKSYKEAVESL